MIICIDKDFDMSHQYCVNRLFELKQRIELGRLTQQEGRSFL